MFRHIRSALADGLRLYGALIYWNLRKTLFSLSGKRGRAPCHADSDDEVVGTTRCDALLHWDKPERFQHVCPLLKHGPEGWRCSVLSKQVRPFWGRMFKWYGAAVLAIYLMGSLFYWGALNIAGEAPIALWRVVWPGSWQSISKIQSMELYRQSLMAFRQGDYRQAVRALDGARRRDPDNYKSKLLMAQISMFQGSFYFSDTLFEQLHGENPTQLANTAVNYQDALVSLNRMSKLAGLCIEMTKRDKPHTMLWVKSLLMALRSKEVATEFMTTSGDKVQELPAFARMLVEAQLLMAGGATELARSKLDEPFRGPWNPHYIQEQINLLCRLKATGDANLLLSYYNPGIGLYESMAQQYLIYYAGDDKWDARLLFVGLLRTELDATKTLRLMTLLLKAPDRESYLRLHNQVLANPKLKAEVDGAAMWVTGLVCDSPEEARLWPQPEKLIFGDSYPQIDRLNFSATRINDAQSVMHVLNVVNLPRDIIWELLSRMNEERHLAGS
jgi:tetratricopeptide (TPR) repeat protein